MKWCHGAFMVVVLGVLGGASVVVDLGEHDQYFMQGLLHPLFNFFHHFFNFLHFNFQFVNLILVCSHGICYDCIDWMTKWVSRCGWLLVVLWVNWFCGSCKHEMGGSVMKSQLETCVLLF
jgi:hypothetical protein